jgi:MoaA/NifB/PqqE/SkfB family radical SAM enzyme
MLLETPPDFLAFSVDSVEDGGDGHPLSVAVGRIQQVMQRREPGKPPFVSFQTTIHADGLQSVLEVVELAAQLTVERVALIRLDTRFVPGLSRPGFEEEERIFRAACELGDRRGVQIDFIYGFGRGLVRWLYRKLRPLMYRSDRVCPKTFDYLYVNNQGKVTPCCALPRYEVGDVTDGLQEIWQGEAMRRFRADQERICGGCDFNTVRFRHEAGTLLDPAAAARGEPREPAPVQPAAEA